MCRNLCLLSPLCLSVALLVGCHEQVKEKFTAMPANATVHLGEQGDAFAKRYASQMNIDRQPAGLNFYSIDWNAPAKGTVTLEHGKHTFTIEDALGILGTQDVAHPEEGMAELDITAGITDPNGISHDEARQKMFSVLQRISQAGWKIFIDRGDPRLRGKDAFNYVMNASHYSTLDAAYIPTLEEWMRIESRTAWKFYADHAFLEVNFTREHTLTDPNKPGAYLINFNLKNEEEHYRGYVGPDNRKHWKEMIPSKLSKLSKLVAMRAETEAKLRADGVRIDETYQDPPLPALHPK